MHVLHQRFKFSMDDMLYMTPWEFDLRTVMILQDLENEAAARKVKAGRSNLM